MTYHNHKEFKCPYCERDFAKKRQLKSHLKDAHPAELKLEQDTIVDEIIDDILTEGEDE